MYYRILDTTCGDYLPLSYNTTNKSVVREDLESLLINLSDDPVSDLPFNKLLDKAKSSGLILETSEEPFEPASTFDSSDEWSDIEDDWDYDDF